MIDKNDNNNYKINDNIYLLENNFRNIIMIQLLTIRIMFHLIKIKME